jgi:hypothetical protein
MISSTSRCAHAPIAPRTTSSGVIGTSVSFKLRGRRAVPRASSERQCERLPRRSPPLLPSRRRRRVEHRASPVLRRTEVGRIDRVRSWPAPPGHRAARHTRDGEIDGRDVRLTRASRTAFLRRTPARRDSVARSPRAAPCRSGAHGRPRQVEPWRCIVTVSDVHAAHGRALRRGVDSGRDIREGGHICTHGWSPLRARTWTPR